MHTISEVAAVILTTHGPDDVTPVYLNGSIFAVEVAGERYPLDMDDDQIDDLLRLIGVTRKSH